MPLDSELRSSIWRELTGEAHRVAIENIKAEVGGTVFEVLTKFGDSVESGETLLIIESMKMEIPVEASRAGRVTELCVRTGDVVVQGQVLVRVES